MFFDFRTALLMLALASTSCRTTPSVRYADSLADCLAANDILILNEACQVFEIQLRTQYQGQELNVAYQAFLLDFQKVNLPPEFFITSESKQVLSMIRTSETFDKIWIRLSVIEEEEEAIDIPPTNESPEESKAEPDVYCTDPKGEYLNCLVKQNKNEIISDYLKTTQSIPGINPGLAAGVLGENLTTDDFNQELTRLIIAIGFYYEFALSIQKDKVILVPRISKI